MKIAITAATDAGLDAPVAGHFGQTPHFVLVEVAGGTITTTDTLANPFQAGHQPGEVPAFIRAHGADVILSGGMGVRAIRIFEQVGHRGSDRRIRDRPSGRDGLPARGAGRGIPLRRQRGTPPSRVLGLTTTHPSPLPSSTPSPHP